MGSTWKVWSQLWIWDYWYTTDYWYSVFRYSNLARHYGQWGLILSDSRYLKTNRGGCMTWLICCCFVHIVVLIIIQMHFLLLTTILYLLKVALLITFVKGWGLVVVAVWGFEEFTRPDCIFSLFLYKFSWKSFRFLACLELHCADNTSFSVIGCGNQARDLCLSACLGVCLTAKVVA